MMNERKALFRQLQHFFERDLFGLYRWGEVKHRAPEAVVIERDPSGRRVNQRSFGKIVEQVVIEFDGYTLIVRSPNETTPDKPAVELYDGPATPDHRVVQGANCSMTWNEIVQLLRTNLEKGKSNERSQRSAGW